jgi:preprotein translocase subunit YajC
MGDSLLNGLFLLQETPAQGTGMLHTLILFGGIILIMYLLVIRPSRKQEQKRREMISRIKKNDRVLTTGGLYGIVMNVKDNEVVLKIDETQNVKVHVAMHAIANVVLPEDDIQKA